MKWENILPLKITSQEKVQEWQINIQVDIAKRKSNKEETLLKTDEE